MAWRLGFVASYGEGRVVGVGDESCGIGTGVGTSEVGEGNKGVQGVGDNGAGPARPGFVAVGSRKEKKLCERECLC
jgi:hypothetical protein